MSEQDRAFEEDVLQIARALWPTSRVGGQILIDGRERDGVFVTEELVHLIECTTSRKKDKAEEDCAKLAKLVTKMRRQHPSKGVKGWFITKEPPTADQRTVVERYNNDIYACSVVEFRNKLVDALSYLRVRADYPFGSMRDPDSGDRTIEAGRFKYVSIDILSADKDKWNPFRISDGLLDGKKFVLLGDFGIGKSTTLREIFINLGNLYRKGESVRFPILLNLRDHYGQSNPAEALERHARNVGYDTPSHLVRAWRAGYAVLLLDGFDEIAIPGWTGQVARLKEIRRSSMELIRRFVEETPSGEGMAIAGRAHYFDSASERNSALGLGSGFKELNLNDFNEHQIKDYLESKGWSRSIPDWFPSRPLLLGYLAAHHWLDALVDVGDSVSPAEGWHALLDQVSKREADIVSGIDGQTVRAIIERLATKARATQSGLGPLKPSDITLAFYEICGFTPDDKGMLLLQRLPGLGSTHAEDGSRDFIDLDYMAAAQAGDIVRFITNPYSYNPETAARWGESIGNLSRQIAAYQCSSLGYSDTKLSAAAERAARTDSTYTICSDVVETMKEMRLDYTAKEIVIRDVELDETFVDNGVNHSKITYQDCYFRKVEIDHDVTIRESPRFEQCYFGLIEGRASISDIPEGVIDSRCEIEAFGDTLETNDAIGETSIPLGSKVLLTVLRKLYTQRGRARQESSLIRGLSNTTRGVVPRILQLLVAERLVLRAPTKGGWVWVPVRAQTDRVRDMIESPTASKDPVMVEARKLKA